MDPDVTRRRFLAVLFVLAIVLLAVVIRPLISALVIAAVLAGVLWPLQRRLVRLSGGRNDLSASLLVAATVLMFAGPIAAFSAYAVDEAVTGAAFVSQTLREQGVDGLVENAPTPARKVLRDALESARKYMSGDVRKTIQDQVNEQASRLAGALGGALAATWSFIFSVSMMLIALFFMLTQGAELVVWLDHILPLGPGQTQELLQEFRKTAYAVVMSTLVTAAVQAVVAWLGYWIANVPHAIFFAGVTFFGAMIPAIGASVFALLAAGILLLGGHPYSALFLAIWAVLVVGLVDNVIKPLLLRGGMDMPAAVVFFSLIGGLSAFGPLGLMLGPLAVAFFVALVRIYERERTPRSDNQDLTIQPVQPTTDKLDEPPPPPHVTYWRSD